MSVTPINEYKIVVLGGGGTGKNEITIAKESTNFLEEYDPTIEDSYRKSVVIDGEPCLLDILDTSGKAEFSSMQDQWMREAQAFLVVYSITSRTTFDEAFIMREKIMRSREEEEPPIVFVGNKMELDDQRQVSKSEGQDLVNEWGTQCSFFEISTANRTNCQECIFECVRLIRQKEANKLKEQERNSQQTCCIIL
eukprot:237266_1